MNFLTAVLSVKLNRKRVVVCLQTALHVFDISDMKCLRTLETASNPDGVMALSPNEDNCHLAFPDGAKAGSGHGGGEVRASCGLWCARNGCICVVCGGWCCCCNGSPSDLALPNVILRLVLYGPSNVPLVCRSLQVGLCETSVIMHTVLGRWSRCRDGRLSYPFRPLGKPVGHACGLMSLKCAN